MGLKPKNFFVWRGRYLRSSNSKGVIDTVFTKSNVVLHTWEGNFKCQEFGEPNILLKQHLKNFIRSNLYLLKISIIGLSWFSIDFMYMPVKNILMDSNNIFFKAEAGILKTGVIEDRNSIDILVPFRLYQASYSRDSISIT